MIGYSEEEIQTPGWRHAMPEINNMPPNKRYTAPGVPTAPKQVMVSSTLHPTSSPLKIPHHTGRQARLTTRM